METRRYAPRSAAAVQSRLQTAAPAGLYGEKHKFDPFFRGPVLRRSCTDVICCWIFVIVIISYIALGIVALRLGDPKKVLHPTDSYGQFCGQKGTSNAKKPTLFYFNMMKCTSPATLINLQCPTIQMCVSQCPDRFATYSEMQLQYKLSRSYWEYYRQFCKPGFNNPDKSVPQVLRDQDCPSMIVPSKPFLQRCLPDLSSMKGTVTVAHNTTFKAEFQHVAKSMVRLLDTKQLGMKIAEDYTKSWTWILIGLLFSLTVTLFFILLLRFTAALMLWIPMIAIMLLLAYGVLYCSVMLSQLRHRPGADVSIVEVGLQTDLEVYLQLRQTWIVLLVILGVTEAAIFFILIFLRKRVKVAIALLTETSRAIGHIMPTLFFPVITFFSVAVCFSYWAITAVYLASSSEPVYKVVAPDMSCPYANSTCKPELFNRTSITTSELCEGAQCLFAFYGGETSYHRFLFTLQLSNLLVFLWLIHFCFALEQCTLAGTFASYYWAKRKPQDIPPYPLYSSFSRALRYHTGSLAFGALILSVIQLIRIVLEYLRRKIYGMNNSLSRFILACLQCCFWCSDKCACHMTRHVYIMLAIYGKNFCSSARDAFHLLMRNVIRVAVLDRVTDFLLFLSKVLIAGGVGVAAFFSLNNKIYIIQEEVPSFNFYWVPLLTVVIGAYGIAHAFFSVYSVCVDTLFLCFCDDLERNDGRSEKAFMSKGLLKILGKSSVKH
ncbi:choline transporter-like protein 5-A [Antennarius striatus]|uniref:choline transporter-like protein 5-A n=1 Tax=Antennarius striatus TaxID=241820 RepID=UPI0035B3392D